MTGKNMHGFDEQPPKPVNVSDTSMLEPGGNERHNKAEDNKQVRHKGKHPSFGETGTQGHPG